MKIFILVVISLIFIGCGNSFKSKSNSSDTSSSITTDKWYKPTKNISWQWQLNGTINTNYDVELYDIDLFDTSLATINTLHKNNKKVICYFSAGSYENWRTDKNDFPDEVLGADMDGWAGERWLDISKIKLLAPIMKKRLDLAVQKGCDGVEPDNIDGYTNNTGFNLSATDQLAYNRFLSEQAHKRGLSIALKNDLSQIDELVSYFDFAVNEQCNQYNECDKLKPFIDNNKPVLNVEYNNKYLDDDNMTKLCNSAVTSDFSTLILPIDLNDTFRYDCKNYFYDKFNVGFGSSASFKFYNNQWLDTTDLVLGNFDDVKDEIVDFNQAKFTTLSNYLQKGKYITYWVTKGWQESWYNISKIQEIMDHGKIPVFVYWYFGDHLMDGLSDDDISNYITDTKHLNTFLSTLKGEYFIILEPEFNKDSIINNSSNQAKFINAIKQSVQILKKPNRKLSLCMMDTGSRDTNSTNNCGYSDCSYGDKSEWIKAKPIYDALKDNLDFISFQEMIGQFSRDDSNPGTWDNPNPKAYTDDELGIDHLATRIDNFAKYLKELYNKPVYLPYITVATATWNDSNSDNVIDDSEIDSNGWVSKAENLYRDLNSTALFGYSVMELFDDPLHDANGYQYFINNEYHLGIIYSDINNSQLTGNISFKGDILQNIFK